MDMFFYVDIPVLILSSFESLNIVKVKSLLDGVVFFVDKRFIKEKPQKKENALSIAQLRGC